MASLLLLALACGTAESEGPQPAHARPKAQAETKRIAVLEFEVVKGVDIDRVYFSDKVRGEVGRRAPGLFVMTRESTEVLVRAADSDLSDCKDECEVETGRRLGADYVISGRIAKVGSRLVLTMRLHATADARLIRASKALGKNTDALVDASSQAVDDLLLGTAPRPRVAAPAAPKPAAPAPDVPKVASPDPVVPKAAPPARSAPAETAAPAKGTLKIVTRPPGARVLIDAQPSGSTPSVKALPSGTYWVTIEKDGFSPIERTVTIEDGKQVLVSETLRKPGAAPRDAPPAESDCSELSSLPLFAGDFDPARAPGDAQWFRVPAGMTLNVEVVFRTSWNETDLSFYTEAKRVHGLNSLYGTHTSFTVPGGRCYGLGAFHKNGKNDAKLFWIMTSGTWLGARPNGEGVFTYAFNGPGTEGTATLYVHPDTALH